MYFLSNIRLIHRINMNIRDIISKKVYYLIGRNKLTADYEKAVWRARNIAAPQRAKQLNAKTPCAEQADRCYDCKSPGRICRGLVTLWGPMMSMEAEILLIDEDLGL